ncbi:protein-methionine-sulfoxide reductase heme-binding subunit MsrQ [Shewanella avicenniae]|uniref:Protein-methionine-sulfoxide reductase heme-binding subunit MsrQ n=1 Tax=Shewanella avicenniae TaxID=2814294 RepID=A0ABX7QWV1_9GAMM|nr:protein-methionine-sulfoxide reductase heme-binding subunit MsrQ [Shewanella avicenniae]QSX35308.1 protein-methionine-sulfoxide reductase heme-binding subunit MsrQ [Shewanella avicenniae]
MRISLRMAGAFRAVVHICALLPLIWLYLRVQSGQAGGDPVQYIIHFLGKGALNLLLLSLLVTPLVRVLKQGQLLQLRRPLGLWAFTYACCHLLAYISFDLLFAWRLVLDEIVKRPYLVLGMSVWLVLFALAITSISAIRRKMGKRWQQLHNLVYCATLFAGVHYYWSVKSEVIEPSIYLALIVFLLLIRAKIYKHKWRFLWRLS